MIERRPTGPVFIAGAVGQILRVGDDIVDNTVQERAIERDAAQIAADKARLRELAPQWRERQRARQRQQATAAYAERLVERERQLFESDEDKRDRFPSPMELVRRGRQ